MVEFLNFVPKQTSFDPELVEVLALALDDAWAVSKNRAVG
jgi:hypothetical protein